MAAWTDNELRRATPIWVARAGDDLYVRAAYGTNKGAVLSREQGS
ncbi:MAG TPA: DUF2255 family protein [Solirubrobacteraceae bacterium]|nr:DUF2255 family protein [Solirubrobacteraceae bacterium]